MNSGRFSFELKCLKNFSKCLYVCTSLKFDLLKVLCNYQPKICNSYLLDLGRLVESVRTLREGAGRGEDDSALFSQVVSNLEVQNENKLK
jgi:hypothetical protein